MTHGIWAFLCPTLASTCFGNSCLPQVMVLKDRSEIRTSMGVFPYVKVTQKLSTINTFTLHVTNNYYY